MSYFSYIPRTYRKFSAFEQKIFVTLVLIGTVGLSGLLGILYRSVTNEIPINGGQWIEGVVGQPTNLNPTLQSYSPADQDLRALLHAGLFTVNENGEIIPHLAKSLPEISADLKTYTITLHSDLKWQDGYPITSDDIIYTIKNIQDKDIDSPLRNLFSYVKIEKIDDFAVKFILRDPTVTFIQNLLVNIIPSHLENATDRNPIGAGPYKIAEVHRNFDDSVDSIDLEANPFFHPHAPYIEKFTLKFYSTNAELIDAYKTKKINSYGHLKNLESGKNEKNNNLLIDFPQTQILFFNSEKSPGILDDIQVRKSLNYAVDRAELVEKIYSNEASITSNPDFVDKNTKIIENSDKEKAKQILEQAGWILNSDGFRYKNNKILSINITTNEVKQNIQTAKLISEQWKKVGIKTDIISLPDSELNQNIIAPRNYESLLLFENIGHDPDPYPFWHSSQISSPGLNFSGFKNTEADRLIIEARTTLDKEVRTDIYNKLAEIITNQTPALFLLRPFYIYNFQKDLNNVDIKFIAFPYERFAFVHEWYLKTKHSWK